ncbi:adenosine deaminase, partial [Acinetobacter baumannii]
MSKSAVLSRGFMISTLSITLTACISMQSPQPTVKSNIPQNFAETYSGPSIAEQGYKAFFSDPRLLEVIEISLNNNR